jgi:hypothetical protein
MWIAVTVGLLLFVIGYFAGGNKTLRRIGMCVLLVNIVGALALPAPMKLYSLVERGLNLETVIIGTSEQDTTKSTANPKAAPTNRAKTASATGNDGREVVYENAPVSLQLFTFLLYLLWTAFLVGMGIFLYETFTVTAEEAEKH